MQRAAVSLPFFYQSAGFLVLLWTAHSSTFVLLLLALLALLVASTCHSSKSCSDVSSAAFLHIFLLMIHSDQV